MHSRTDSSRNLNRKLGDADQKEDQARIDA